MGEKLNEYGSTNTSLTNIMAVLDAQRTGLHEVSLTEYASTSRPLVAAGSYLEIAGSLFEFSTNESASSSGITSTVAMTYWIEALPTSSLVSVSFSSSAPVWRTDYNGFYRSTTSNNRYIQFGLTFDGTDYTDKFNYIMYNNSTIRSYAGSTLYSDDILCINLISSDATITNADISTLEADHLKVVTNMSIGSTAYYMSEMAVQTGAQGGFAGVLQMTYPAGFTMSNCYILSALVEDASTHWVTPGGGSTDDYRVELRSTSIWFTHVGVSQNAKILLARST